MSQLEFSQAPAPARQAFFIFPWSEALVALTLFVTACLSMWLTFAVSGISLLWPASAIAAAIFIRLGELRWGIATALTFVAVLSANVAMVHRPWGDAALFACLNVFEIVLMVGTFRHLCVFPYPHVTITQAGVMTALFGLVIPGCAAAVAAPYLHWRFGTTYSDALQQYWSSHAVGACLLGPPIILFSVKEMKRLTRMRFVVENLVTAAGALLGCYLSIRYVRFPFVVIGLLLLMTSFRLGGLGTSFLSLALGLLITNLWLLGIRPLGLDSAAVASRSLAGLPVAALLSALMPAIAVGLGSDMRRHAVRALRVSERRFRESMAHSPIGMLISNLDGVWGYTNIALQQMLGYSAEEFGRLPPGGPSDVDDWKESEERWRRLLTGEIDFYDVMRRFQHKDGRWIWTRVAVSLLRDEEGVPLHLIAQIESLEARQLAEARLAQERERLNITLSSINDAVITTDANSRITYLNPAAEVLLGLNLKETDGRRVDEVIHLVAADSARPAVNLIAQAALHGKVSKREEACLLHRSDGSLCYVSDTVSPILDGTGALNGLVIVLRDATQDVDRARDLQFQAMHDPLTGLSNRTVFQRQLESAFKRAWHANRPAAVLAIDLDRFKALNDSAGHAAGDAMLKKVADTCRLAVRSSDTVARLGGDEFAIILGNCAEDRAHRISNQLLKALNGLQLEWLGSTYTIGASMGLAVFTKDLEDVKAWLAAADSACFLAKREGRGRLLPSRVSPPPDVPVPGSV